MERLNHYVWDNRGPLVVSFSGGKSSAYQLSKIVEANGGLPNGSRVVFDNTGFELPQTLNYVRDVGEWLGVPIDWVEFDSTSPTLVRIVNHNSAARAGEPFIDLFTHTVKKRRDGTSGLRPLPNPAQRVCTAESKIKTTNRFLRQHCKWPTRYWSAVGFRADESSRRDKRVQSEIAYEKSKGGPAGGLGWFPMHDAGVTAEDIFEWNDSAPVRLELEAWEGNCDFCFLKAVWKIKEMMKKYPDRAQPWIQLEEMDRDRSNRFRTGRPSYAELFQEVQEGNMSAPPQDASIICENCTG